MARPVREMSFLYQPLDKILSGVGAIRVLRALLAHGGHLPVSRLAEDTLLTPEGVRRILPELETTGVVEGIGGERTRLYRAVPNHPMILALNALFAAERDRARLIMDAIRETVNQPAVLAAWIFGSVASGQDRVGSDLDIAVVIDAPVKETATLVEDIRARFEPHERRLGFTASVVPFANREHPLRLAVVMGKVQLIKGPSPQELLTKLASADKAESSP